MDTAGFEKGLKLLDQRFRGGKSTPEAVGKIYFSRLKYIPNKPWLEICEAAMDDCKTFPTPGELKSLWYQWKNQHPELIAKPPRTDCPECWGTGLLWAKKTEPDLERIFGRYQSTTVFRCAKCENWKGQVPETTTITTRKALESMGYEVERLDGSEPPPQPDVATKTVRSLASNILKTVPPLPSSVDLEERRRQQKADLARYLAEHDDEPPF